jgi:hypothetical protein
MTRIDDDTLALHLEVALAGAAASLLDDLAAPDWRRRRAAAADMAQHLVQRLGCFDIRCREDGIASGRQPSLLPGDLGPLG